MRWEGVGCREGERRKCCDNGFIIIARAVGLYRASSVSLALALGGLPFLLMQALAGFLGLSRFRAYSIRYNAFGLRSEVLAERLLRR